MVIYGMPRQMYLLKHKKD